jgi:hypothetical protein
MKAGPDAAIATPAGHLISPGRLTRGRPTDKITARPPGVAARPDRPRHHPRRQPLIDALASGEPPDDPSELGAQLGAWLREVEDGDAR